ncbi:MAG: hypothetical protein ABR586_09090, partial [Thermoplasmatota archaeon]
MLRRVAAALLLTALLAMPALADGPRDAKVTDRELSFLHTLRDQLGLSAKEAEAIEETVERTLGVDSKRTGQEHAPAPPAPARPAPAATARAAPPAPAPPAAARPAPARPASPPLP